MDWKRKPTGRPRIPKETEDLLWELYQTREDMSIKQICAACQVSTSTLYRVIKAREGGEKRET